MQSTSRVGLPIDSRRTTVLAAATPVLLPPAERIDVAVVAHERLCFSAAQEAPTPDVLLGALRDVALGDRPAVVAAVARGWATRSGKGALARLASHASTTARPEIAVGLARAAITEVDPARAALLAVAAAKAIAPGAGRDVFAQLGPDGAVALTRALGLDARRYLEVGRSVRVDVADVPASVRVRAAERLVVEAARSGDVGVVATVFGTFDPRALRPELTRALAAAVATDSKDAARLEALLDSDNGRRLLFARGAPAPARLAMLRVVRRDPTWTAARIPTDPWIDPDLARAAFAERAADFALLRGDTPVALAGTDLENTVGTAMGFAPNLPNDTASAERAAAEGKHDYFAEEPTASVVAPIAAAIRAVGGATPLVTVVPIQVSSAKVGLVQLSLFRVRDAESGEARFVDDVGRTYASFDDWSQANVLPPGHMTFPAQGRLTGALDSAATPRTVDTPREEVVEVLDTAALAGGLVAGGAALVGSGGTAAPVIAIGAGAWAAGRSAGVLSDRWQHGQSVDPTRDAAARAAWLEVAAGAVGAGALVSAASAARFAAAGTRAYAVARATASISNVAAIGLDAAAAFDAGHALLSRWDQLPAAERASLVLSLGFWGVQVGTQLRTRRPFDVAAHREALAGARERPSVETARELRTRGFRDTMGMAGTADAASPHAHLRAIARGRALAEELGGRALARIRGIFEPSAALRRERDGIASEMASLWRREGSDLSRALATDEALRGPSKRALVERYEALAARQASVDVRIARDLRVRRVVSRAEGAEVMRGFLDSLGATGVPRVEAERMAAKVTISTKTARALEAGGVDEAQLRAWLADFFQLTTKTRPPGELRIEVAADRARYVDGTRTVDLGKDFVAVPTTEQRAVLFHELAHSIEAMDPALGRASVEWVRSRAEGAGRREVTSLRALPGGERYGLEEVALEDHFVDPYMGKVYEGVAISEVVSSGLERLVDASRASDLYRRDPELFFYLLGTMR